MFAVLALVAPATAIKGKDGYRILCIDGGGTRGIVPLTFLEYLERESGPLHEQFDLIVGTSIGGIMAIQIGIFKQNTSSLKILYDEMISEVKPRVHRCMHAAAARARRAGDHHR